jgi:hypothetical protein
MSDRIAARRRVLDDRADLAFDEIRRRVVRPLVDHHVLERRAELQPAALPRRFVDLLALFGRGFDREPLLDLERHAVDRFARRGPDFAGMLFNVLPEFQGQRRVARRHRVVRGPLENGQMLCRRGDDRRRLDTGRARADHADPLAGEVDAVMRPLTGVVPIAHEVLAPGEIRHVRRGQAADGGDQEFDDIGVALLGAHPPAVCRFVVMRGDYPCVEPDVPFQVEPVGDEIQVAQNLGLAGIAF